MSVAHLRARESISNTWGSRSLTLATSREPAASTVCCWSTIGPRVFVSIAALAPPARPSPSHVEQRRSATDRPQVVFGSLARRLVLRVCQACLVAKRPPV